MTDFCVLLQEPVTFDDLRATALAFKTLGRWDIVLTTHRHFQPCEKV